jgi:hypothetical protein
VLSILTTSFPVEEGLPPATTSHIAFVFKPQPAQADERSVPGWLREGLWDRGGDGDVVGSEAKDIRMKAELSDLDRWAIQVRKGASGVEEAVGEIRGYGWYDA